MKIHLWCPSVDPRAGGIENYSCAVVRALCGLVDPAVVSVFAKHDTAPQIRKLFPPNLKAAGTGQIPRALRTAAFSSLLASRGALERPDLIVSTHVNFAPFAMWLKRTSGLRYCVSLHGIEAWTLQRPSNADSLRAADLLMPVSRFTRETVARAQQLPDSKFRIVPNTIDSEQFAIGPKPGYLRERHFLAETDRVILSVGRLAASEQYKGHDRVIRALPAVRRQLPELRYVIVGDGDDRPRLEALAGAEGVADAVTFAGRVEARELPDYYRLCDLFALPSTGEGFGIVFLEALACGRPVLGGTRDAARDPLLDGEAGVLVDPDNIPALAEAITAILTGSYSHPLIYRPAALRDRMLDHFGFDRFQATLGECIRGMLGPF